MMKKDNTIDEVLQKLIEGNQRFVANIKNDADLSAKIRQDTAENNQKPDAILVTCSDSRVPPEHIFSAGIGELFVIRTAGHVIGDFELGTIEYAAAYLGAKIILVMGHNHCGAVATAMDGHGNGYIQKIIDEIRPAIIGEDDVVRCEKLNINHSVQQIMKSDIIKNLVHENKIKVISGKYNLESGLVEIFPMA
jgi:carbonic anhydrase